MQTSYQSARPQDVNAADPFFEQRRSLLDFCWIVAAFAAIYLLSWKEVFSLDLWILKDRGSFLNLDYLLQQHFRLGVDTFYSYGLLPVAIQHGLFVLFGRGYWPLLGCAVATLILIALFCTLLLRFLPREWVWLASILLLARIVNVVNPNLAYSLVQLSLMFALLCVLWARWDIALAVSAIGCWSVPSLPIVMSLSLAGVLLLDWLLTPGRSLPKLLRAFAPGVAAYVGIGVLLGLEFSYNSVFATATPLAGMSFYRQVHFGSAGALMQFLHPSGHKASFYLAYTFFTPVAWWVASTLCLALFGILAVRRIIVRRALDNRDVAIVLCALLQIVFVCVAYGSPHQHYIFDPILITGVLLGCSAMNDGIGRRILIASFIVFGIAGQTTLWRADLHAWKQTRSPSASANLYADAAWISEWKKILQLSTQHDLLLFSYSTGVHHYFPSIHSPNVWTLQLGQLLPADKARILSQLDNSEVVVLDLTSPTTLVEMDDEVQRHLYTRCLTESTDYFQIWWRQAQPGGSPCIENPRRYYGK